MHKAMLVAVAALITSAPAFAAWDFKAIDGPLGNAKVGVATLTGDQGDIVVRCDITGQNSLFLVVRPRPAIAGLQSDFMRPVRYRIDGGVVKTANGIHDDDEISVVNLVRGLSGGELLFSLMSAKTLTLDVTDAARHSYRLSFRTEGAGAAIAQAARTCGDTNWLPHAP